MVASQIQERPEKIGDSIMDRMTQFHCFEIWQRRFHDNKVLLAAHKVGEHNKIIFTKDNQMGTDPYYIAGKAVKKYKKVSNGKIMVYAIPVDELQPLELSERSAYDY